MEPLYQFPPPDGWRRGEWCLLCTTSSGTSSANNSSCKHSLGQQLSSPLGALVPGHPRAACTLMVKVLSHHDGNRILSLLHTGIETKLAFHVCQLASCEEAASPSTADLTAANLGLRLFLSGGRTVLLPWIFNQIITAFSHHKNGLTDYWWNLINYFQTFWQGSLTDRKKKCRKNNFSEFMQKIHNSTICKIATHLSKVWSAFLFNSSWVPFRVAAG